MSSAEDNYNRGGLIAFLFSMVFSFAFFVWVSFVNPGVDLKEVPVEEGVPVNLVEGGASGGGEAFDVASVKEPWLPSDAFIAHGAKVYKTNCALCHGPNGEGDGPAGKGLAHPPRNLITGGWEFGGDRISLYKTLRDGISGTSMASFKHLPVKDRWALVHWIQSITQDNKKKVSDQKAADFASKAN